MGIDTLAGLVASLITAVLGTGGWLVSKLWQAKQHEIRDIKIGIANNTLAIAAFGKRLDDHLQNDANFQTEVTEHLGNIKENVGFLRGLAEGK